MVSKAVSKKDCQLAKSNHSSEVVGLQALGEPKGNENHQKIVYEETDFLDVARQGDQGFQIHIVGRYVLSGGICRLKGYRAASVRTASMCFLQNAISSSVSVGCTKNVRAVPPSSTAFFSRSLGRHGVLSKAFSKYTSEQPP